MKLEWLNIIFHHFITFILWPYISCHEKTLASNREASSLDKTARPGLFPYCKAQKMYFNAGYQDVKTVQLKCRFLIDYSSFMSCTALICRQSVFTNIDAKCPKQQEGNLCLTGTFGVTVIPLLSPYDKNCSMGLPRTWCFCHLPNTNMCDDIELVYMFIFLAFFQQSLCASSSYIWLFYRFDAVRDHVRTFSNNGCFHNTSAH